MTPGPPYALISSTSAHPAIWQLAKIYSGEDNLVSHTWKMMVEFNTHEDVLTHTSIRLIHQLAQPTHQSNGYNNILI